MTWKAKASRRTPCRGKGRAGKHAIGLDAKKAPTTSEPRTRIDAAERPHIHEAVNTSRSRALGVVSAVALLLALGIDVHPS